MLCLGDSYTIGQSVAVDERFPEQTLALLKQENVLFEAPEIIARTGWTSLNLINAIERSELKKEYDYVTLLIGVNDQFQGIDTTMYKSNFEKLLKTAIALANNKADHIFVLSIPDYGVTPFAKYGTQPTAEISNEIDIFNSINKIISEKYNVHYINITSISRDAEDDASLLAGDGLHPSGKMYKLWAELLSAEMFNIHQH
ncbi:MAG: SGNH/GDSL hydrolase family protein [Chitinophagales bacterium]